MPQKTRPPGLEDFVSWDVPTWSAAIEYWDRFLAAYPKKDDEKGLELGAHYGGLSLYLAARRGANMVCTDLKSPEHWARPQHEAFGFERRIVWEAANALALPYQDASFDFVIFKSLLGEIGTVDKLHNKRLMLAEVLRVLKPGGAVLFAENMVASPLHVLARKAFRGWGKNWGYTTIPEMRELFAGFADLRYETTGFLVAFAPARWKPIVRKVDRRLDQLLPANSRYVIYGSARKPTGE
jgi:ubiquinone/menaquinone biosynthesis C-methylase UbiE